MPLTGITVSQLDALFSTVRSTALFVFRGREVLTLNSHGDLHPFLYARFAVMFLLRHHLEIHELVTLFVGLVEQ